MEGKIRTGIAIISVLANFISPLCLAGDDVYVTYSADGTPTFSTQPYDRTYSLYLRGESASRSTATLSGPRLSSPQRRAKLAPLIQASAREQGVDPALVSAIVEVESGFNPAAVSPKGAVGVMQLIPTTAAQYGVADTRDPQQNLAGGIRYLKDLLATYQGNLPLALAAYNAGQRNVRRHNQRIPPFSETMLYVPQVLARMEAFRRQEEITKQ